MRSPIPRVRSSCSIRPPEVMRGSPTSRAFSGPATQEHATSASRRSPASEARRSAAPPSPGRCAGAAKAGTGHRSGLRRRQRCPSGNLAAGSASGSTTLWTPKRTSRKASPRSRRRRRRSGASVGLGAGRRDRGRGARLPLGSGSSDVLHDLLRDRANPFDLLVGHSKGALRSATPSKRCHRRRPRASRRTLGCPIAANVAGVSYHQYLGLFDALGQLNMWGNLRPNGRRPGTRRTHCCPRCSPGRSSSGGGSPSDRGAGGRRGAAQAPCVLLSLQTPPSCEAGVSKGGHPGKRPSRRLACGAAPRGTRSLVGCLAATLALEIGRQAPRDRVASAEASNT